MVKNLPANAREDEGDPDSIPGSERFPGGGHGNPLHYSCLENLMDRGAQRAAVHRVTKSRTQLSNWARAHINTHTHTHSTLLAILVVFNNQSQKEV